MAFNDLINLPGLSHEHKEQWNLPNSARTFYYLSILIDVIEALSVM